MIRDILALGLSNDKERIGVKTALCSALALSITLRACQKPYTGDKETLLLLKKGLSSTNDNDFKRFVRLNKFVIPHDLVYNRKRKLQKESYESPYLRIRTRVASAQCRFGQF